MFRKPLVVGLAMAGALAFNPASGAMKAGEYLDGLWFSPSESGRGISVDFIPIGPGGGQIFGAVFSFDDGGNNEWVTIQAGIEEHQFTGTGDLFVTTGGSFGFPFSTPQTVDIGDVTVTLNHCTSVEFDLDIVAEGTGYEDVTLDLIPLSGAASNQCVYEEAFTACPDFARDSGTGLRECLVSGQILDQDITLTNDITWVLDGLLEIGAPNANASTLHVEPGTVITSVPDTNNTFIYVHAGSEIQANGLPYAPIVWTSAFDGFGPDDGGNPQPGDTGGLAVAGLAPCNSAPGVELGCFSEFASAGQVLPYGGTDENDSSGSITYMQIRYAGIVVGVDAEVNTFSFLAVGRGTRVEYIQAYRSLDDGLEAFAGNVNIKYYTAVDGLDDYFDWDEGWSGQAQFGMLVVNDEPGSGAGFEGANNGDAFDALPRATPIFSNYTVVSRNDTDDAAFLLKEGTGAQIWNSIGSGYGGQCVLIEDQATITAAGPAATPTGTIAFAGTFVNDCATLFESSDQPGYAEALFNSPAFLGTNSTANPMLDPVTLQPMDGSPVLNSAVPVFDLAEGLGSDNNQFFTPTNYSGAFGQGTPWIDGWTYDPYGTAN
ncbi:MAG: hypothetical protein AAGH65_03130 [Pseudomonadota bacterium]